MINSLIAQFKEYSSNPIIGGLISLWGLSVLAILFRDIPRKIVNFVVRQSTTTLTLNNSDDVYYDFLNWVSKHHFNKFVRNLNFYSRYTGDADETRAYISIGYGTSFFISNGRIFAMKRELIEASNTVNVKERITVTVFGRNHDIFKKLFAKAISLNENSQYIQIYGWGLDGWRSISKKKKRDIESVVLNSGVKERIVDHIQSFINDKSWYLDNGLPYHTGILLQGPSGTGKSSLIKSLSSHFEKDLYVLNLSGMGDDSLRQALASAPSNSIVVIEDIDAQGVTLKRNTSLATYGNLGDNSNMSRNVEYKRYEEPKETKGLGITISGILNALDGVSTADDRIIIATTNHPEKLDAALTREGRFDLKVYIGYANRNTIERYLSRFFTDVKIPDDVNLRSNIAMCEVQRLVIDNRNNLPLILKKLSEKKD